MRVSLSVVAYQTSACRAKVIMQSTASGGTSVHSINATGDRCAPRLDVTVRLPHKSMTVKAGHTCTRSIHDTLLPKDYVQADGINTEYGSQSAVKTLCAGLFCGLKPLSPAPPAFGSEDQANQNIPANHGLLANTRKAPL